MLTGLRMYRSDTKKIQPASLLVGGQSCYEEGASVLLTLKSEGLPDYEIQLPREEYDELMERLIACRSWLYPK